MKKNRVFTGLILGLGLTLNAQAQEKDFGADLPEDLQQQYMRTRLAIEVINQSSGSLVYNANIGVGATSSTTSRRWVGYRGFGKVSEATFYTAAGYGAEAEQIRAWKTTGALMWVGGAGRNNCWFRHYVQRNA